MLDPQSLEVISRFKQAVLTRQMPLRPTADVLSSNRGRKLEPELGASGLTSKVVEYDGANYLVTSNRAIDKNVNRNKRKWRDYEAAQTGGSSADSSDGSSDDDGSSGDEDPLAGLELGDILAGLAHPSELVSHPAISRTYRAKVLSQLASELIEVIHVEQNTLNWLNKLLQVLNGEDWYYLLEQNLGLPRYDHGLRDDGEAAGGGSSEAAVGGNSETPGGVNSEPAKRVTRNAHDDENDEVTDPFFQLPETLRRYEMRQSRAAAEDGASNAELAAVEEDLTNYLQVSIQRQQEYIKNLSKLRNDVVRAERLKQDLYKWSKEMYDKKSS